MSVVFDDEMKSTGKVVFDDEQKTGGKPPLSFVGKQMFGMLPQVKTINSMIKNPQQMLPIAGMGVGTALGGPLGGAAGAGLGQIGSRMVDIAKGSPVQSPGKEAIGPMAQTFAAGIPEVSGIFRPGTSTLAQKIGQGLDRTGQTLSGVKKGTLPQVTKEGFNIYKAPSLPKAQELFGMALGPEGQTAMKQTASEAFDPVLSQSRQTATEIGTKIEQGQPVTAIDALKARQATDDIISSTSPTDKNKLNALYKWRGKFDDVMTSQSGPLKGASNLYRRALVKDQIMSPTRITKSGRPSAFLPMVLGAGGRGLSGILSTLAGTSPAAWGLGAATLGSINPMVAKSGLAALIQRMIQQGSQPGTQSQGQP